jgi:hypothetical protein
VIKDEIAFHEKPRLLSLMGLENYRTMVVANNIRVMRELGRLKPEDSRQTAPEGNSLPPDALRLFEKAEREAISNPSERLPEDTFIEFYPPPTSRRPPDWTFPKGIWLFEEEGFLEILHEIYAATRTRLPHLAIMGIRAILEQTMIKENGGDYGRFEANILEFEAKGFISLVQRKSLEAILDVGHAVIHRSFKLSQRDLDTALDIMEGILAAIYHHRAPAEELLAQAPPRRSKAKKPVVPKGRSANDP